MKRGWKVLVKDNVDYGTDTMETYEKNANKMVVSELKQQNGEKELQKLGFLMENDGVYVCVYIYIYMYILYIYIHVYYIYIYMYILYIYIHVYYIYIWGNL